MDNTPTEHSMSHTEDGHQLTEPSDTLLVTPLNNPSAPPENDSERLTIEFTKEEDSDFPSESSSSESESESSLDNTQERDGFEHVNFSERASSQEAGQDELFERVEIIEEYTAPRSVKRQPSDQSGETHHPYHSVTGSILKVGSPIRENHKSSTNIAQETELYGSIYNDQPPLVECPFTPSPFGSGQPNEFDHSLHRILTVYNPNKNNSKKRDKESTEGGNLIMRNISHEADHSVYSDDTSPYETIKPNYERWSVNLDRLFLLISHLPVGQWASMNNTLCTEILSCALANTGKNARWNDIVAEDMIYNRIVSIDVTLQEKTSADTDYVTAARQPLDTRRRLLEITVNSDEDDLLETSSRIGVIAYYVAVLYSSISYVLKNGSKNRALGRTKTHDPPTIRIARAEKGWVYNFLTKFTEALSISMPDRPPTIEIDSYKGHIDLTPITIGVAQKAHSVHISQFESFIFRDCVVANSHYNDQYGTSVPNGIAISGLEFVNCIVHKKGFCMLADYAAGHVDNLKLVGTRFREEGSDEWSHTVIDTILYKLNAHHSHKLNQISGIKLFDTDHKRDFITSARYVRHFESKRSVGSEFFNRFPTFEDCAMVEGFDMIETLLYEPPEDDIFRHDTGMRVTQFETALFSSLSGKKQRNGNRGFIRSFPLIDRIEPPKKSPLIRYISSSKRLIADDGSMKEWDEREAILTEASTSSSVCDYRKSLTVFRPPVKSRSIIINNASFLFLDELVTSMINFGSSVSELTFIGCTLTGRVSNYTDMTEIDVVSTLSRFYRTGGCSISALGLVNCGLDGASVQSLAELVTFMGITNGGWDPKESDSSLDSCVLDLSSGAIDNEALRAIFQNYGDKFGPVAESPFTTNKRRELHLYNNKRQIDDQSLTTLHKYFNNVAIENFIAAPHWNKSRGG